MDKEFYVIELFKRYGCWSTKTYPYYKRSDGATPNLELARKFATHETALQNMPKRKYPNAKIHKVINGEVEGIE